MKEQYKQNVECPLISLLSKNAMLGQTIPIIDE